MDYRELVRAEAVRQGLDPNLAFSVVQQESNWNPTAVSPAGAYGLFQLMAPTAADLGVNRENPEENIRGGITYLKKMIDQFGLEGGLAAYNAGPGRYQSVSGDFSRLPQETQKYVPSILKRVGMNMNTGGGGVSVDQIITALGRAREANDAEAISGISAALSKRFQSARDKAASANDTAAVTAIDAAMARILGGAPAGAAITAPVVSPEAPVPAQQLSPLEGEQQVQAPPVQQPATQAAPVVQPTTTTPEEPSLANVTLGQPREIPQVNLGDIAEKPVTDESLNTDPKWIGNAKQIYKDVQRKEFTGSDEEAANWLKSYIANSKWNLVAGGGTIADIMSRMSDESKKAFLESYQTYSNAPVSLESVGRGIQGIATDPTTYLTGGVGNLLTKTFGKKAAEQALMKILQESMAKTTAQKVAQAATGATAKAAATGATYGVAGEGITQGQQIAAGGQEGIDVGDLAASGAIGAAGGAGINKILEQVTGRAKVRKLFKGVQDPEEAKIVAEVTKDFEGVLKNPAKMSDDEVQVLARDRNQKVQSYVKQVENALNVVDPALLRRIDVRNILSQNRVATPEELAQIRQFKNGDVLADAIQKYQVAVRLTNPTQASGDLLSKGLRFGIEMAPKIAGSIAGAQAAGPWGAAIGLAIPKGSSGWAQRLTGKRTVPERISELASPVNVQAAETLLRLQGPSRATLGAEQLTEAARRIQEAPKQQPAAKVGRPGLSAAEKAAKEAEATAKKAEEAARKSAEELKQNHANLVASDPTYLLGLSNEFGAPFNEKQMSEFSKVLRLQMEARQAREAAKKAAEKAKKAGVTGVPEEQAPLVAALRDLSQASRAAGGRGSPISGAYSSFLQYTGLSNEEGIQTLRKLVKERPDSPLGRAAKDLLQGKDIAESADFYALQNLVRNTRQPQQGALAPTPGALSDLTPAPRAPVNPEAYKAAVSTALGARDVALQNAPNDILKQFVSEVAGAKSRTEKAKLLEQRLANTTDPAEVEFLKNFVEPLTKFGKKAK